MRVVHVSPTDIDGGASKGAFKLHKALQAAGADSLMLVQRKYSEDASVVTRGKSNDIFAEAVRDKLDRLPLHFYGWRRSNWWTVSWLPFDISETIDRLQPDVVHLHWAGRGAAPIEMLKRLRPYPVVWTLRDMWPITGGCHYSGGCEKFVTGCGSCPELSSRNEFDISRWQWRRKQRAWKNVPITFVALSRWMEGCAKRSPLTTGSNIVFIPNGVDLERFVPIDKAVARRVWNLPSDKRVIAFGAIKSTLDPRKGFVYLRKALQVLAAQGWKDRAVAVVFGAPSGESDLGLDVRYMGHLHEELSLALLYASADVMVSPSLEENSGKTGLEALACGVPVVAFANTGQLDIVDHKVNGYLAENLSASDLARGIAWCLEEGAKSPELARRAREKAEMCFDLRKIVGEHLALYRRLVAEREGSAALESASLVPPPSSRMEPVTVSAKSSSPRKSWESRA